jgi:hypothetical protein
LGLFVVSEASAEERRFVGQTGLDAKVPGLVQAPLGQ